MKMVTAFNGNMKKAAAGLRRINLDGLRWRVFDAKGQVFGRLASQIATVVQGKDKPTYTPNRDDGDMCIVLNAKDICVTGRKLTDKVYYWHTGYIGHLKQRTLKDQMAKDPTEVIRKAVLRMLPRNKLRDVKKRLSFEVQKVAVGAKLSSWAKRTSTAKRRFSVLSTKENLAEHQHQGHARVSSARLSARLALSPDPLTRSKREGGTKRNVAISEPI